MMGVKMIFVENDVLVKTFWNKNFFKYKTWFKFNIDKIVSLAKAEILLFHSKQKLSQNYKNCSSTQFLKNLKLHRI